MKIDKNTIDKVLTMNDDQLWKTIQYVAKKSGNEEFSNLKKPDDMGKIRQTLSMLSEDDINRAINTLKRGKENGRK